MTELNTAADHDRMLSEWRVPSIDEMVDTLQRHLTTRVPHLNERLQSAAMSAILNGRATICEYPVVECAAACRGPKITAWVEQE